MKVARKGEEATALIISKNLNKATDNGLADFRSYGSSPLRKREVEGVPSLHLRRHLLDLTETPYRTCKPKVQTLILSVCSPQDTGSGSNSN